MFADSFRAYYKFIVVLNACTCAIMVQLPW